MSLSIYLSFKNCLKSSYFPSDFRVCQIVSRVWRPGVLRAAISGSPGDSSQITVKPIN